MKGPEFSATKEIDHMNFNILPEPPNPQLGPKLGIYRGTIR